MGGVTSKDVKKYPRETLCDHDKGINCMATSEDGSLLVTGAEDKTARLWDIRSRETECIGIMRGHTSYVTCVAVHDTFIVTGAADATLRKWDTITCDCLFTYRGHKGRISRVLCTGEYILSSSQDKTTKAWHVDELILDDLKGDADDIACIRTFKGHDRAVYPMMVDPGEEDETGTVGYGDLVVTGSLDCTARSWDFVSGNCLQVFKGHTSSVVAIVTDSDTRLLYTASADKTIRSWHIDTGVNFRVFEGHKSHITCLLALNKLLYSGDGDGVVRVWDLTARDALKLGRQQVVSVDSLASFRPATNTINAIKLHNGMLFIASSDNLARAVDAATREVLAVYTGHQIAVTCMAISGEHFYTGSTDTTLRVWDMPKRRAEGEESSSSNEEESEEGED